MIGRPKGTNNQATARLSAHPPPGFGKGGPLFAPGWALIWGRGVSRIVGLLFYVSKFANWTEEKGRGQKLGMGGDVAGKGYTVVKIL